MLQQHSQCSTSLQGIPFDVQIFMSLLSAIICIVATLEMALPLQPRAQIKCECSDCWFWHCFRCCGLNENLINIHLWSFRTRAVVMNHRENLPASPSAMWTKRRPFIWNGSDYKAMVCSDDCNYRRTTKSVRIPQPRSTDGQSKMICLHGVGHLRRNWHIATSRASSNCCHTDWMISTKQLISRWAT